MASFDALRDNFQGTVIDTNKWTANGTTSYLQQLDGQLIMTPTALTSGYCAVDSGLYDLTGSYVMVKNESLVSGSSTEQQLIVEIDEPNKIVIFYSNGGMVCRKTVAGVNDDTYPGYDASRDIWWRIRESGGTIYMETSPDSVTWTTLRSFVNPFAVTSLLCILQAGNYDNTVATPNRAVFSRFNLPHRVGFKKHFSGGGGVSTAG